jgi:methyl-accepting chemotaxis protein
MAELNEAHPEGAQIHRRQLRNYLLNRNYQLKHALIPVIISALLVAGLGYFWYDQMRVASRSVEVKALATMPEDVVKEIRDDMASQDRQRLLILLGFGLVFALVVAGYGIVLTHKVAGPLFKIGRYMSAISEGKLGVVNDLRRGDHLQDFFEEFKQMHSALRARAEQDLKVIDETLSALERSGQGTEPDQSLGGLREIRARLAEGLKS